MLLARARSIQGQGNGRGLRACSCEIRCPTCRATMTLRGVDACTLDAQMIQTMRKRAAERASKKVRYQQGSTVDKAAGGASDSSEYTDDDYWTYKAVRAGLPYPHASGLPSGRDQAGFCLPRGRLASDAPVHRCGRTDPLVFCCARRMFDPPHPMQRSQTACRALTAVTYQT